MILGGILTCTAGSRKSEKGLYQNLVSLNDGFRGDVTCDPSFRSQTYSILGALALIKSEKIKDEHSVSRVVGHVVATFNDRTSLHVRTAAWPRHRTIVAKGVVLVVCVCVLELEADRCLFRNRTWCVTVRFERGGGSGAPRPAFHDNSPTAHLAMLRSSPLCALDKPLDPAADPVVCPGVRSMDRRICEGGIHIQSNIS